MKRRNGFILRRSALALTAAAIGAIPIIVSPAGAAESSLAGEQARKSKVYELVAFSATSDVAMVYSPLYRDHSGESHTRAKLAAGKRYPGGYAVGGGTMWFNLDATVDTRFRSSSYSCAESFQRGGRFGLRFERKGARVLVLLWAPYVLPALGRQSGDEWECRKIFTMTVKIKYYPLSLFKRKTFTLTHAGVERSEGEGSTAIVRYKTRFVLKRLR